MKHGMTKDGRTMKTQWMTMGLLALALATGSCQRRGQDLAVKAVEPGSGTTMGGDQVVIKGTGFEPGAMQAEVRFGRKRAEAVVMASPRQISLTTPPGDRVPVDVTVIFNDGRAFTLPAGFSYVSPQVSSKVREAYLNSPQP